MPKVRALTSSSPRVVLLALFLDQPAKTRYVAELVRQSGKGQGSVHAALGQLVELGWLEQLDDEFRGPPLGRPHRFYYRLTPLGLKQAPALVESVTNSSAANQAARS